MSARTKASRLHRAGEFHDPHACLECHALDIALKFGAAAASEVIKREAERLREESRRYRPTAGPKVAFRSGAGWVDLTPHLVSVTFTQSPPPGLRELE